MGRIGKAVIEETMQYLEKMPHAVSRPTVQKRIKRELASTCQIIKTLVQQGRAQMLSGTDDKGRFTVLYWPADRPFLPPPGIGFAPSAERKKDALPKHSPFAEMRRKFGPAKQEGIARPWYLSCLFGDGPAHVELPA